MVLPLKKSFMFVNPLGENGLDELEIDLVIIGYIDQHILDFFKFEHEWLPLFLLAFGIDEHFVQGFEAVEKLNCFQQLFILRYCDFIGFLVPMDFAHQFALDGVFDISAGAVQIGQSVGDILLFGVAQEILHQFIGDHRILAEIMVMIHQVVHGEIEEHILAAQFCGKQSEKIVFHFDIGIDAAAAEDFAVFGGVVFLVMVFFAFLFNSSALTSSPFRRFVVLILWMQRPLLM
jgi:hypothetical protein